MDSENKENFVQSERINWHTTHRRIRWGASLVVCLGLVILAWWAHIAMSTGIYWK